MHNETRMDYSIRNKAFDLQKMASDMREKAHQHHRHKEGFAATHYAIEADKYTQQALEAGS